MKIIFIDIPNETQSEQKPSSKEITKEDKTHNKKNDFLTSDTVNIISFSTNENGELNLIETVTNEENGRFWGLLNGQEWLAYEGLDGYIMVGGETRNVKAYWDEGSFWLNREELVSLFSLAPIGQDNYVYSYEEKINNCPVVGSEDEVIHLIGDISPPIEQAKITTVPSQIPGAPRSYRNGFHEGFDWYSGAIGLVIDKNTEVTPMYEGEVVRIDHTYKDLEEEERNELLRLSATENNTPQNILDKLRGRQVWIQSDNGVLVRYAHLDQVESGIDVGDFVTIEQKIGTTGNTGTSDGVKGTDDGIHLHTDILICGKNFWEYGDKTSLVNTFISLFNKDN